jgi:hypothetical protein
MFTSYTYVTFTGTTNLDTLDSNLKIGVIYDENKKTLQLSSKEDDFNGLILYDVDLTQPFNGTYEDDKFFKTESETCNLRYNSLNSTSDSIYISKVINAQGGWSHIIYYSGKK